LWMLVVSTETGLPVPHSWGDLNALEVKSEQEKCFAHKWGV
jgi:hypothetical protein